MTPSALREIKALGFARLKMIDGRAPPGVDPAGVNLTQRWETYQVLYRKKKERKFTGLFIDQERKLGNRMRLDTVLVFTIHHAD